MRGRVVGVIAAGSVAGVVACAAGAAAPADVSAGPAHGAQARVRPGVEVLLSDSLHLVRGRNVGLVTNQSGVDGRGVGDVERLRAAGVRLTALFSPEHGFRGAADPGATVASTIDSATGLPIYSLYGRTAAPTDSMLAGLDVMLIDLQDAGARYYTYLSTTVEVMRSAKRKGIPVVVLDRPDPIGGAVQGDVLDTTYRSFVGLLAVPMRHGMTLGELARLANADLAVGADLRVVPAAGWRRDEYLDATGLPFVPPSPNLRTIDALIHYPGLCLFEGTNLSVGRGSDAPFEQVGAPWLDTAGVLAQVRAARLKGVEFRSVAFTPRRPGDGKYADTMLAGIRLHVTDRTTYDPTRTAVTLLAAVIARHGRPGADGGGASQGTFAFLEKHFDRLAGTAGLRARLLAGEPAERIVGEWREPLHRFEARRRPYLLYPE